VRQLVVDGKPFLILGGELNESTPSSGDYMKPIWPRLVEENLNTVFAAVSWELIEPEEGQFDFSSVDSLIEGARRHHLHLIFLWFGSWKNGESSYTPYWVKVNPARFPLAQDGTGKTLSILSTFSPENLKADERAFAALMRHIREIDGQQHTVLMMQVENEMGILGDSRDRSPIANEEFNKPVPEELTRYLLQHKESLAPELRESWAANGYKASGTWTEVFGPDNALFGLDESLSLKSQNKALTPREKQDLSQQSHWPADEFFMAWNYSRYVEKVTEAGKAEYNIPMYANAWMHQMNPPYPKPGSYPSGVPVQEVHDIWRAGAPAIDILAPDLYRPLWFRDTCEAWTRNKNPLFFAESSEDDETRLNAVDAVLEYNAISFSSFGVDNWFRPQPPDANGVSAPVNSLAETFAVLNYLAPVILENQGKGTIVILAPEGITVAPQQVKLGNYTLNIRFEDSSPPAGTVTANSFPRRLVILEGPDEYIFVGGGMNVNFTPDTPGPKTVQLASFDESILVNGHWEPGRRLNGGQSDNNSRWPSMRDFGIYRIKVYRRD